MLRELDRTATRRVPPLLHLSPHRIGVAASRRLLRLNATPCTPARQSDGEETGCSHGRSDVALSGHFVCSLGTCDYYEVCRYDDGEEQVTTDELVDSLDKVKMI